MDFADGGVGRRVGDFGQRMFLELEGRGEFRGIAGCKLGELRHAEAEGDERECNEWRGKTADD